MQLTSETPKKSLKQQFVEIATALLPNDFQHVTPGVKVKARPFNPGGVGLKCWMYPNFIPSTEICTMCQIIFRGVNSISSEVQRNFGSFNIMSRLGQARTYITTALVGVIILSGNPTKASDMPKLVDKPNAEILLQDDFYPPKVQVTLSFGDVLEGFATVCLVGKNPTDTLTHSRDCLAIKIKSNMQNTLQFKYPEKYALDVEIQLPAGSIFKDTGLSKSVLVSTTNSNYSCQLQKKCKAAPTPALSKPSNASIYADGYRLISASPETLRQADFYSYFSANRKMSKNNATRFCQSFVRLLSIRTDYFDALTSKQVTTFIQGCAAAAVKIPYGK